ncbi:MAG: hypothetical protein B6242_14700 [Anaerolineaceae bacterium 4572_78]|nr:MAG: hypothetical protein B6242_14700 [Anaerolineaceae bacterium 4572_78]
MKNKHILITIIFTQLIIGLGCSLGSLLVQAPTPTPTPTKTPRPIFTATLFPTDTPLPTNTPLPTDTNTPVIEVIEEPTAVPPTDTPIPTNTSPPQPPPQPQPPTNTPIPTNTPLPIDTPLPTATPAPSYPFPANVITHLTGSQVEFRISGLVWKGDVSTGYGETMANLHMRVIIPTGAEELSNISAPSINQSTRGGDNHTMNFEYKHSPYLPGKYTVHLMRDSEQIAPTVEIIAQEGPPFTYAHIDFVRSE